MSARWSTFLVWALVAASALFWGLRLFVSAPPLPARTPVASNGSAARGDLTRLFGVDAPPPATVAEAEPPPDSRFQLIGVVAARDHAAAQEGVALIAVDGKPAKAFRVGAVVDGQTILKSVAARGAALGPRDGGPLTNLNLTPPPAAATGSLPGAPGQSAPAPSPAAFAAPPTNSLQAAQRKFQQAAQPAVQTAPLQSGQAGPVPQMGPLPQAQPFQPAGEAARRVLPPPLPQPIRAPMSEGLPRN